MGFTKKNVLHIYFKDTLRYNINIIDMINGNANWKGECWVGFTKIRYSFTGLK